MKFLKVVVRSIIFLMSALFFDNMARTTIPEQRDLHRLVIILDYQIEEMLKRDEDLMASDWLYKNGALGRVRELDAQNPFLILRHDGHYERFENVDKRTNVNTGFIRPWVDIICYYDYLDSLIDGTPVSWHGNTWELEYPRPITVVVDMMPQRYWRYFERRDSKYHITGRVIDAREFHNRATTLR